MNHTIESILYRELRTLRRSSQFLSKHYKLVTERHKTIAALFSDRLLQLQKEQERFDMIIQAGQEGQNLGDTKALRVLLKMFGFAETEATPLLADTEILILSMKVEFLGIASYRAASELCESLGLYKMGEILDQSLADKENFCHELTERLRGLDAQQLTLHSRGSQILTGLN